MMTEPGGYGREMLSGIRQSVLAVLCATVVTSALWLAPAEAATPASRYAADAVRATNAHRAEHDRAQLRKDACLTRVAVRWAMRLARRERLVHQSLNPVVKRCNLSWAGENIAMGYRTGTGVVNRGWMRSDGHRANILRPQYRLVGIGAARDKNGRWWSSQVFGRR